MDGLAKYGIVAGLALALSISVPEFRPVTQVHAASFNLKKVFKKQRQKFKAIRKKSPLKKIIKSEVFRKVVVPLVIGAALNRAGVSGAFGVAIAIAVAGAPKAFQIDMANTYGDDWRWSGCLNCGERRIVVVPGREISKARKSAVLARTKEEIRDVQRALKTLGHYKKKIDADYGPGTKKAVKNFQSSIGEPQTDWLNAEQRYILFTRAEDAGLVRQASTLGVGVDAKLVTATVELPVQDLEPIPEYRLANSQFQRFTKDYLKVGPLTAVVDAQLRADGMMIINVKSADIKGGKKTSLFTDAEQLFVQLHPVSQEWATLVLHDRETGTSFTLNILDEFRSSKEAKEWMHDADNKISILAKLTGRKVRERNDTVIANENSEPALAPQPITREISLDKKKNNTQTAEIETEDEKPKPENAVSAPDATENAEIQVASLDPKEVFIDKTNLNSAASTVRPAVCRDQVYLSFNFPPEIKKISHYNIIPPEEILMMDNGDSTAYFTGACVQGNYEIKYVHVEHSEENKTWKHIVKEAQFKIASNSEQCDINLVQTSDTAEVNCY